MKDETNRSLDCRQADQMLLEAFDQGRIRELPSVFNQHVQNCRRCQVELKRLEVLHANLDQIPEPHPGDAYWRSFLPTLRGKIEATKRHEARDRAWIPAFAISGMMALLLWKTPAHVSPPAWWLASQDSRSVYGVEKTQRDTSQTATLTREIAAELDLDQTDLSFIEALNQSDAGLETSETVVDKLIGLDDQDIEDVLTRLKNQPIIRS